MNADAHGSISMITINLEDHRSRQSGNPFIYHEEHKGKEEKMKNDHRLKKKFHHEGHEGARRNQFSLKN
jgi:hypothetical protein